MNYEDWIAANYPDYDSAKNQCNQACRSMIRVFSELSVRFGKANGVFHCWLVDELNNIIDPTVAQFDDAGDIEYRTCASRFLDEGDEVDRATGVVFLKDGTVWS